MLVKNDKVQKDELSKLSPLTKRARISLVGCSDVRQQDNELNNFHSDSDIISMFTILHNLFIATGAIVFIYRPPNVLLYCYCLINMGKWFWTENDFESKNQKKTRKIKL